MKIRKHVFIIIIMYCQMEKFIFIPIDKIYILQTRGNEYSLFGEWNVARLKFLEQSSLWISARCIRIWGNYCTARSFFPHGIAAIYEILFGRCITRRWTSITCTIRMKSLWLIIPFCEKYIVIMNSTKFSLPMGTVKNQSFHC